jgi:hypothetical protein
MNSELGKYMVPLGFFAVGAICEMYTGTKVIKYYKDNKKEKTEYSYHYNKGTGLAWGTALAIITLPTI